MTETRIPVGGDQPYEVIVGTGVLSALPDLVGKRARTVAVIHDERLTLVTNNIREFQRVSGLKVESW